VSAVKSKPKELQQFKVDPVLKIDETVYKQAESMCSVHTYTSFVIQEIFDCKLLEIRQYSSCLLIPIPSSIDAAASNLQNLGEIAQEFFNQTLSNLELGYIFELNNSQFSTKFLSCLNFHFKVLDRNSIVGNS